MSFPFNTISAHHPTIGVMKNTSECPYRHGAGAAPSTPLQPAGAWPPGPKPGITGWGLLRRMSKDLLGVLRQWQREYGDLVHLRIWPEHQLVVTDPGLARELLVHHHHALIRWERGMEVFSELHGHSVLIAEGEAWKTKRQALQPNFGPKPSQALVPNMAAAAQRALSAWQAGATPWPIEQALTTLTMEVIAGMAFSGDIAAEARQAAQALHELSVAANREFFQPVSPPRWLPSQRAKAAARGFLEQLIGRHVAARLQAPRDAWPDDMLSRLLALHQADPATWPLRAVRDECMTTFLAGHETAAATLTWWAWCMAANPAAQQAARDEVDAVLQGRTPGAQDLPLLRYVAQTLQETMRLYPAAPVLLTRRTTAPITLGGWRIPARTLVTIPVHGMQHDARWFPDPQAFRPERFAPDAQDIPRGAFMPFGTGPRICLGQHLVMTEMTVIAAMILQRFALAPEGAAPRAVMNVTLRPERPLSVQLTVLPQGGAPCSGL
jgi:unspecific monooxygenase